jgi:dTDP-4-dehydrorhamnose 3,5-epimerase-like enzyme
MNIPKIINLPDLHDDRGNLNFFENYNQIPFAINRVSFIYVASITSIDRSYGGYAYKENNDFIISLSGSLKVKVNSGSKMEIFYLEHPHYGLFIPKLFWYELSGFSNNFFAMIVSSNKFNKNDVICDYRDFCLKKRDLFTSDLIPHRSTRSAVERIIELTHSTSIHDCFMIKLPKQKTGNYNFTTFNNSEIIPFDIHRIYYLYNVHHDKIRGRHAHKKLWQLFVATSGSFDIILNDGKLTRIFTLSNPDNGLLVVPGIWRELNNFSHISVCMVLASLEYDPMDYIRDYNKFLEWKNNND